MALPTRTERLTFDVCEADRTTWRFFQRYHYLSDRLPGGRLYTFGLFHGADQMGFLCFAQYIPQRQGEIAIFHANRVVIHPDYAGLGLGRLMLNACCEHMAALHEYRLMIKMSSDPLTKSLRRDPAWMLLSLNRNFGSTRRSATLGRGSNNFRENIRTVTFEYVGPNSRGQGGRAPIISTRFAKRRRP